MCSLTSFIPFRSVNFSFSSAHGTPPTNAVARYFIPAADRYRDYRYMRQVPISIGPDSFWLLPLPCRPLPVPVQNRQKSARRDAAAHSTAQPMTKHGTCQAMPGTARPDNADQGGRRARPTGARGGAWNYLQRQARRLPPRTAKRLRTVATASFARPT